MASKPATNGSKAVSLKNTTKKRGAQRKDDTAKSRLPKQAKRPKKKSPAGRLKRDGSSREKGVANTLDLAAELLYGVQRPSFRLVNGRTKAIERVVDREEMEAELRLRDAELREQFVEAQKALKKMRRWLRAGMFGEGVGCTIGLRTKFGHIVSPLRYVIQIHVPYKLTHQKLKSWPKSGPSENKTLSPPQKKVFAVPDNVDGVLTKVMETGAYLTDQSGIATTGNLPGIVRIGASNALKDIAELPSLPLATTEIVGGIPTVESLGSNWGTLGIVIRDDGTSAHYGIVNAHFANGNMVQPPKEPISNDLPLWSIGTVVSSSRIQRNVQGNHRGDRFYVDAALVELNGVRATEAFLVHEFGNEPLLFAQSSLRHHHSDSDRRDVLAKVFKFGAKTLDRIEGFIENPEDESVVIGGRALGKVIRARRNGSGTFTLGGDSGSALIAPIFDLVSQRERLLVVGLCFAGILGDNEIVYACQFASIIKALNLNLPSELLRRDWRYRRT